MFAIHSMDICDAVETVYSCTTHGTFYCKYADNPYKVIDTDEERTHLMNNFYEIHEMIHVMDDRIELICHDRYLGEFITYEVEQFNPENHIKMIDELFNSHIEMDEFERSFDHIQMVYKNSYEIGAYE